MLILTPSPLETAAERAFFAELASWDTGGSIRAAVVASLPLVDDGPMHRRQADAVLFVPEGLAVLRIVEVVRQSGMVTASPDRSWTIGPGAGPGEVLQLAGGGSNPLEGLMRAGMEAAVALRSAGLEPGRIARLTVLTGGVTGLIPADGDLGDGDQVALLDPRSLLLGVARASRYAGAGNPRLWTTADVRAGIEALGVLGRSPAVEELNGEGFPYSPYVLRRRELIEPMNLPSARGAALPTASGPTPGHLPDAVADAPAFGPAAAGPLVDPAAAGRVAAAAMQAEAAAGPMSAATVGSRSVTPVADRPDDVPHAPRTRSGDTGGIGALFGEPVTGTQRLDRPPPAQSAAVPGGSHGWAPGDWGNGGTTSDPVRAAGGPRRRAALVMAVGVVLVAVLGVGGWLLLPAGSSGGRPAAPLATAAPSPVPAPVPGPATGARVPVGGVTYTMQVGTVATSCTDHSYGRVAGFFAAQNCLGLSRALWSADVGGKPAVVSLSRVLMPDPAAAQALRRLADSDGTGNVNDLLREGVSYAGAPRSLSHAQYASAQDGATVTIVETSWAGAAPGSPAQLSALAAGALGLPAAGAPGTAGR